MLIGNIDVSKSEFSVNNSLTWSVNTTVDDRGAEHLMLGRDNVKGISHLLF